MESSDLSITQPPTGSNNEILVTAQNLLAYFLLLLFTIRLCPVTGSRVTGFMICQGQQDMQDVCIAELA